MAYISAYDDTKMYAKAWRSVRPVILRHGWLLSADSWDDSAVAIANAAIERLPMIGVALVPKSVA